MSHSNPRIKTIHDLPVKPLTSASTKTRSASISIVGIALFCFAVLASTTTRASAQAINFGSINVCPSGKTTPAPCSANQTLTFTIPAGTTIGSIAILTTGQPGLDFKAKADDTSTTLCKAQTYSSATTCTVDVTFAPLAAGFRKGAVELLAGTTVVAMTYVDGTGVGPAIAFSPSAPIILSSGSQNGYLAIDGAGNIFTSPLSGNVTGVNEIIAAGGYTKVRNLAIPFDPGGSIAIDGAGNLFVDLIEADEPLSVKEILAATDYTTVKTLFSGSHDNYGAIVSIVVDSTGNLFFVDSMEQVVEIPASGGYSTHKTLQSGIDFSSGLAIDSAGNLFLGAGNLVKEILVAGGYTTVKTFPFSHPVYSVAVDADDNLIVSGDGITSTFEVLAEGGYTTVIPIVLPSNQEPYDFAIDSNGNLFYNNIVNATNGQANYYEIVELPRSHPPALLLGNSVIGSSPNTQSVTLQNSGNATLTGSFSLSGDTEFSVAAGSGRPPDCTDGFSLAPNGQCSLSIDFTAQSSGPVTGSLVLTDNASNETSATQSIALSGNGVTAIPQVSPASLQFGNVPYTESATQSLTVTNVGTGTLTIDPSSNGRGAIVTGNTCGAGIGAGKSCTLQVEFKPVQLGSNTNTVTILTNGLSNPKVPVRGTATGVGSPSTTLDFGTVKGRGNSVTVGLDVVNIGVPGAVTVATETGATTFKVTYNDCTSGVTQGEDCNMNIEFAPVSTGPETAYLKLIPSVGPEQIIVMTGNLIP